MAHLQKLDAPALAPGCDFFTRSTRGPFIDTGVDIDERTPLGHRIYICEDNVGEWARMFGWISPADADEIKTALMAAREREEDLVAEVQRLRTIEDALKAGGFTVPEPEDIPITEFPHHKGGGWWLFSDGTTERTSKVEAERIERELTEQGLTNSGVVA